jgi:hypothetical protein
VAAPLHTRELGSQLTNVLRCLYLEAMGYQVTVTELVGWEHSLKNELIVARAAAGSASAAPPKRLRAILAEFGWRRWKRCASRACRSSWGYSRRHRRILGARAAHGGDDSDAQQDHGADHDVQLRHARHHRGPGDPGDEHQEAQHVGTNDMAISLAVRPCCPAAGLALSSCAPAPGQRTTNWGQIPI